MSDDLYLTRLRWSNGAGIAKLRGRQVTLQHAPVVGGGPVHFIDYIPEIRLIDIRRTALQERVDDMTPGEVREVDALLAELTRVA